LHLAALSPQRIVLCVPKCPWHCLSSQGGDSSFLVQRRLLHARSAQQARTGIISLVATADASDDARLDLARARTPLPDLMFMAD
jgi:hypothetical protein